VLQGQPSRPPTDIFSRNQQLKYLRAGITTKNLFAEKSVRIINTLDCLSAMQLGHTYYFFRVFYRLEVTKLLPTQNACVCSFCARNSPRCVQKQDGSHAHHSWMGLAFACLLAQSDPFTSSG
jgi:hypothetical protein